MKRKLVAALMAMTLVLSSSVAAFAEEPSENGIGISQTENGEDGESSPAVLNNTPDDSVTLEKISKEKQEGTVETPEPPAEGENTGEEEIPLNEAHFPDANFREYLKTEMDTDGNGSLSKSEIENTVSIMIGSDNYDIKDFKGIEYFSNLDFLVLDGMSLDSLDVSKNTKLVEVSLWNCQISNLALNSSLRGFGYFKGTQISNLDASNLKLKHLWCDGNLIPGLMSIPTLEYIKLYNDVHLPYLDLSNQNIRLVDDEYGDDGTPGHHGPMGGAFIAPQTLTRTVTSVNGVWTLDMASVVGRDYLDRVTIVSEGAKISEDGLVTFQGSEVPKELVYNFDTKTPAETTLMEVTVALTGVNDQTKEEVSVDTSGMDLDGICKDNNVSPDNAEIVVSQETPSKEDADKLAGEATSKGYKVTATYEILLNLFSQGKKIAEITENFGAVTLTLQAGKDYAGRQAVVFQLHNGQVIEHNGLTVKADGTVTITVDKFSTFAVAVSEKTDSSVNEPVLTPGTSNPPAASVKPVSTDNKNKTTGAGSVKTGDQADIVYWMVLSVIALGVCGIFGRKKFYRG